VEQRQLAIHASATKGKSLTIATHTAGSGTHAWRASGPRDLSRLIARARRHSAWVRGMRFAVPATALGGLGLVLLASWLNPLRSMPQVAVSAGNLVVSGTKITMEAPKLTGFTRDNRAYNLTAEAAAQDITDPTVLELTGVRAKIELQNKATVNMTAVAGIYDTKSELVTLSQHIVLINSEGYEAHLTQASADVRKGNVISEKPVEVFLPNGKIDANRMEIIDSGVLLRFDAGVIVNLTPASDARGEKTAVRPANALQGFSMSRDKPVRITATTLEVRDKEKRATFIGDVVVTQGDATMKSKTLDVYYDQDPAAAKPTDTMAASQPAGLGDQQIRRLEAKGGITLTQKDQTATGDSGIFEVRDNVMTVLGNVVVTQGPQTLKGDRLTVDMTSGVSHMDGRISGVMFPNTPPKPADLKAAQQPMSGPPNALQGFSVNRDKPIQITAAALDVRDKEKKAIFSGTVVVVQGDTTMKSKTLDVFYDQEGDAPAGRRPKAAQSASMDQTQVRRLEAKGGVVVTQKDQIATGDTGVFDMPANTVTLVGHVVTTQAQQVIKGDRLIVNLTTGVSNVEGNISMLAFPNQTKGLKPGDKSGEAKPDDTGSGDSKPGDARPETMRGRDAAKPSERTSAPLRLN